MKKIYTLIISTCLLCISTQAQDTFSITVADSSTKFLGSAGASCIANSIIISDIVEGFGVIHTQSFYISSNQQRARQYMEQGFSPVEVLQLTNQSDAQADSTRRQYGIADLMGRTAAYTGDSCLNFHKHITGQQGSMFYSIQGNILLKESVIDSMEAFFRRTPGSMEDKMMAALQGANFPGADSRCLDSVRGLKKPAISAFIRLGKPGDDGTYDLDLNVPNTKAAQNPIDSLQKLYDAYKLAASVSNKNAGNNRELTVYPVPANNFLEASLPFATMYELYNYEGKKVVSQAANGKYTKINTENIPNGLYILRGYASKNNVSKKVIINH